MKVSKLYSITAWCLAPCQGYVFVSSSKNVLKKWPLNFSRGALFYIKTRVSRQYFATDWLWKHFFDFNSSQTSSNLIYLIILLTLRLLTRF